MAKLERNPVLPTPPNTTDVKLLDAWRRDLIGQLKKIFEGIHDDLKSLDGYTFEGDLNVEGDLAVEGDLTVTGALLPIGTIYFQLPGKEAPADLFGGEWTNVSSSFAGVFFRAEGGNASSFGGGNQAFNTARPSSSFTTGNQSADHSHSIGTESAAHTHTVDAHAAHSHYNGEPKTYSTTSIYGATSNGVPGVATAKVSETSGAGTYQGVTSTDNLTAHNVSGESDSHTHSLGNQSASHTHTITGGGDAETRPVNITIRIWERTA
jgi:hypothetical protein